ncbi:MAG TPA: permease prefix domain 1-containing protein, partial [Gemmatimonadaceae bacterium]
MLNAMLVRLKALVFRDRVDAELDEELRYHLEREVERNVAHGMTEADAHDAARRALGNITVATEQARDALRWRWFEELRQDVSFAVRTFSRAPAFAFTVVATIGLGLGLVATVFTVFNAYVLRPLPVRDPMALYEVIGTSKLQSTHLFTWQRFQSLRARADLLDDPFAYAYHTTRIRGTGSLGQIVSGNYFSMLGVPPALGRTLVPNDVVPSRGNDVVVLSHRM